MGIMEATRFIYIIISKMQFKLASLVSTYSLVYIQLLLGSWATSTSNSLFATPSERFVHSLAFGKYSPKRSCYYQTMTANVYRKLVIDRQLMRRPNRKRGLFHDFGASLSYIGHWKRKQSGMEVWKMMKDFDNLCRICHDRVLVLARHKVVMLDRRLVTGDEINKNFSVLAEEISLESRAGYYGTLMKSAEQQGTNDVISNILNKANGGNDRLLVLRNIIEAYAGALERNVDDLLREKFLHYCYMFQRKAIEAIKRNAATRFRGRNPTEMADEAQQLLEEATEQFELSVHQLLPPSKRSLEQEWKQRIECISKDENALDDKLNYPNQNTTMHIDGDWKNNGTATNTVTNSTRRYLGSWGSQAVVTGFRDIASTIVEVERQKAETEAKTAQQQQALVRILETQNHQISTLQEYIQTREEQMMPVELSDSSLSASSKFLLNVIRSLRCGFAYRPPNSNINVSGAYNQRKTSLQVSCVPDELSHTILGNNGFVHGVLQGNLGLSASLNI